MIKEWFADYYLHNSDVTFDFTAENRMTVHNNVAEPWKVTLVDTGLNTMTGGRIKRIASYIGGEPFLMTYGDGVSDIPINKLVEFHKSHGRLATISTVQVGQRFGIIEIEANGEISAFREKAKIDGSAINGGFMVLEPKIFDYLKGDETIFEKEPLERLAAERQLVAFRHEGFWQCMDTQRDKALLEELWEKGIAPWKVWE